jgi:NAD(P)-dependent dehydrogenase (short-subunit alcohol dehydrogenase family)
VLVNNAGINPQPRDAGVASVPVENVAHALDVNAVGSLRMLQAAIPLLRKSAHARVVNVSSGAGSLAHNSAAASLPAYCMSKAALNMLTRRAAHELADITIVSISPGWIRTDMGGPDATLGVEETAAAIAATIESLERGRSGQWLDRFGKPSEYAW